MPRAMLLCLAHGKQTLLIRNKKITNDINVVLTVDRQLQVSMQQGYKLH